MLNAMLQYSKVVLSRTKWRVKCLLLSAQVRLHRRKEKRDQARIDALEKRVMELTAQQDQKKVQ